MTHKVTVIGGGELPAPPHGDQDSGLPRRPRVVTAIQPTALPPVNFGAAAPPAAPVLRVPHAVSRVAVGVAPAAPVAPSVPVAHATKPAAVAGDVRMVAVSVELLRNRFPDAPAESLEAARNVLASTAPTAHTGVDWLSFGLDSQGVVNALLKEQIKLFESPARREAEVLLSRLHRMLVDVLEALEGGLFRKAARVVWQNHSAEFLQIEPLLTANVKALRGLLEKAVALETRRETARQDLVAHDLAGQYLMETIVRGDEAPLLQSRVAALLASQSLAEENRLLLDTHIAALRQLVLHIQDSIFVRLAAVASQISALPDKPNETERFVAREALGELTQLFERSKQWL
ncbi:hypothetical protein G3A43_08935 [Paraburkholderia aspalathi]|nr:hypothetical protein [Paraburkholderia aspalathi]MBK3780383.1 hypothetical protein [Paraburkholderia aspalathi]